MSRLFALSTPVALITFALACAPTPAEPPAESEVESAAVELIALPADVTFPEGIAYDPAAGVIYTASALDGALVRVDLSSGASELVVPAGVLMPADTTTFPGMVGMAVDPQGRLWMAGGRLGQMSVVETATGTVVAQREVPTAGTSLINDVVVVGDAGYFTDTSNPVLWRLEISGGEVGEPEPWIEFEGTPIEYGEGADLNGIEVTPDGQTLIVIQMAKGLLFQIDIATKAITPIDTAGADLSGADGLVLDGQTLYVVRQTAVEIATVELSPDLSSGVVISRFTDPTLAWPATAALAGGDLLVVNTQFDRRSDNSQTLPFTVARVPVSLLAAPMAP